MIDADRGLRALLDDVAQVLLAAGCADPFTTTPALRLRCMLAGERLQDVGALPRRGRTTASLEALPGVVIVAIAVLTLLGDDIGELNEARKQAQDALRAVLVELG